MAQTDLGFNITALDKASRTFLKLAERVDKMSDRLDELDRKKAEPRIDVDTAKAQRQIGAFARSMQAKVTAAIKSLPDIDVDANTSDADAQLAGLRTRMEALQSLRLGVDIDTDAALAELAGIQGELEALSRNAAKVDVRVDAGKAAAELVALRKLAGHVELDVDTDKANRAIERTRTQMAALTRHELAGLITAAAAISPAFVAAGAAAGAFGAVAAPSLVKVVGAQEDIGEAWAGLDNRQRAAALSLRGLIGDYQDLAASFEPQTLEVFNTGLDIGRKLMGQLEPLIETSADAFVRLGHEAEAALGSPTWTNFVGFLTANAGPSIEATGEAFGNLTALVLNTIQALNPLAQELLPIVSSVAELTSNLVAAHPELAQFAALALLLRTGVRPARDAVDGLSRAFTTVKTEGLSARAGLRGVVGLLGGPWGVAVAGAAALLGVFVHQQAEAAERAHDYADALRESNGALDASVRQSVAKSFADEKLLRSAHELGLTTRDLVGATLGEEGATRRVNAAIKQNTVSVRGQFVTTRQLTGAARQVKGAVDASRDSFAEQRKELQLDQQAQQGAATAAQIHAQQVRDLRAALKGGADQAENLRQALDALTGAHQTAAQTEISFEAAIDAATAAARKNGRTLDTNTAKGRANKQTLVELATEAQKRIVALKGEDASQAEVNATMTRARSKFIAAAKSMGATSKQAQRLANDLLGIPKNNTLHFNTPGLTVSIRRVHDLRQEIARLHGKTVFVRTVNTSTGSASTVHFGGRRAGDATAAGGIFTRPERRLIGEAGPEVVLPVRRPDRARSLARQAGILGERGPFRDLIVYASPNATAGDVIGEAMHAVRVERRAGRP